MIFADRVLRTLIQFRSPQRGRESSHSSLGGMPGKEFHEVMLRGFAGEENERIILSDGVEMHTPLNEIQLGEKLTVCIVLKVGYPPHAGKTQGLDAVLPRRKDDIESERFEGTTIYLSRPAINVNEFLRPDSRRRFDVLVSAQKYNFHGMRPIARGADALLVCQGKTRKQHSCIMLARRPAGKGLVDDSQSHQNSFRSNWGLSL